MHHRLLVSAAALAAALVVVGATEAKIFGNDPRWLDKAIGIAPGVAQATRFPATCSWCPETLATVRWTRDGGRTWPLVWRGVSDGPLAVATSARAAVLQGGEGGDSLTYWTRDGGRHWFATTKIPGRAHGVGPVGAGSLLFWADGSSLYQVRPWPPKGAASCRPRGWTAVSKGRLYGLPEVYSRRNICEKPQNAGMRAIAVGKQPGATFLDLAAIPGGVVGLLAGGTITSSGQVLVRRHGQNRVALLPEAERVRPWKLVTSFPQLVVLGLTDAGPAGASWLSEDGGETWSLVR